MASGENLSNIIWKARRKLAEALLQIDPELILDVADSHLLFTQREFFSLNEIKDPQELIGSLIDMILGKGKQIQELFLDCLENLRHMFPNLQPISEYLEDGLTCDPPVSSSITLTGKRSREENLENRATVLVAAMSPERGNEAENLNLSMSSEAGSETQSQNAAMMLLDPCSPSVKDHGVKNLDVSDEGNIAEKPAAAMCSKNGERGPQDFCISWGTEQSSLQASEDLTKMQNMRETPELTPAGNTLHSGKVQENLKEDVPLGTSNQGSMDSVTISGDEMIRKGRKQLIEIIQKDLELILDELISQSVITEEEYEALDKNEEDSKKKIRKLLIQFQKSGGKACDQFLECLETVCPGSNRAVQCSIRGASYKHFS